MPDIEYEVGLDDSQVLKRLRELSKRADDLAVKADRMGDRAEADFKRVNLSAQRTGTTIGAVAGITQELTRRFIDLGTRAARAFINLVKGGVELNRQAELIQGTADSFDALTTTIDEYGRHFQKTLGAPIFEELKKQATAFLEVLAEYEDDIERVALAFGDMAAAIVRLVGTNLVNLLNDLPYDQLEQVADDIQAALAAAELFAQTLQETDFNAGFLQNLHQVVLDLQTALLTLAKISLLAQAELAKRQAEAQSLMERGQGFKGLFPRLGERLVEAGLAERSVVIGKADAEAQAAGQKAYNDVIAQGADLVEAYQDQLEDLNQQTEARTETVKQASKAETDLIFAEKETVAAREKIGKQLTEAATERERKLTEIMLDAERERLDDAIKAAQKREDLARQNAQEIEDILRGHDQAIADAATDLSREEEDIARKAARDRAEVERDAARERVDIETDFRRELERIRARFEESAAEAERRNDAQAFLAAMRQRDREIQDARRTRDENLEDAATRAEEQRAALAEQLQFEIEDARIANARKLEDLQLRLNRELEEQQIKYQRDLEEQTLQEQRQAEQRALAYQQELEDFARKEAQKLADLQKSLTTEFELVRKFETLKRQTRVAEAQATVAQVNAILSQLNPFGGSGLRQGNAYQYYYRGAAQRQAGGDVEPGRPYIVGERGPELFVPQQAGQVVPNAVIGGGMTQISHVINNQRSLGPVGVNVSESIFNDPIAVRKMRNIIMGVLAEAL